MIIVVSSLPGEDIPEVGFEFADKLAHFLEYLVLGVLLILAFKGKKMLLWAGVFGVIDELHQFFIPGRECSPADLAMNLIGVAVSPLVFELISYLIRKRKV